MKKKVKVIVALCAMVLLAGCSSSSTKETQSVALEEKEAPAVESSNGKKQQVKIHVKEEGVITVELDDTYAPITVDNFVELAREGFYDGLTFHRIIQGFMMQGGDPLGTGLGGSDENIKGEFSSNGVENPLSHTRGAISMARSQDKDSASSQFFIVHEDSPHLDGEYAVFGYVTEGMEIVDKICKETPVVDNNGTVKDGSQPVIEKVEIIE